jgi:hypothetical protein
MKHERCLSFSFGHCVVCSSSRCGLWFGVFKPFLKHLITFVLFVFVCLFVVVGSFCLFLFVYLLLWVFSFFSLICSIDDNCLSCFNTFCAVMVGVLVSSGGFRGIELRSDETQNYAIYIFCFFASHTSLSTSIKCISSLARALYLTRQH